ncbi:methyltransferase family protein [Sandaracinus amylolyticus]|uniref:methyltransferase family protein n=1 Tax=Sandaracinus amylolyticus TaxID=927083 RepID=UPI001F377F12|nr:isoprenylcysteine carboxylmethyltransferase family protein [Sandaracinus amylolyticus]UJR81991.1 Isoprenylcysteine carboxyl methyltransferase [Sandaracinus amylolyticus]
MPGIALIGWIVYVGIAFGLRTWMQIRATGESGFVGLRRGAGMLERFAGVLMVLAFLASLFAPIAVWLGLDVIVVESAPLALTGGALIALGTAATLHAQIAMRDSWRIGVDPGARTELVVRGPFRLVRNPIFTAMILASLGLGLACPSVLGLLAPIALLVALEIQVRVVEEPYLARVHGEAYRAYARRVGRFVPGLGRLA